jgi:LmbE family N-acetylglucosaminyl deacetylase
MFTGKRILIVVAHPDDEVLGLGGTMHRLISDAHVETHVVILGEGITSRSDKRDTSKWAKELSIHKENIHKAKDRIGYTSVSTYDLPDNRFDTVPLLDIIKIVDKEKSQFKPDMIFTHHGGDLNVDHRLVFQSVMTAARPMQDESVSFIVNFETPSGTEWRASTDPNHFIPNLFVPIRKHDLDAKISAMEAYEFEKRKYPHPRSPEALTILAQRWGVACGVEYAEAFSVVRGVVKEL